MLTTQVELLAAVLAGSPRRPLFALVTETYVMIESDALNVTHSFNTPLDGTTSYIDSQDVTIGDFTFELDTIVITQDQKPDVLSSNMITGAGLAVVRTITEVDQDQKPDVLLSNMTTGAGLAEVRTILEVTQDQKPDILNSNMTTAACSATVTTP